MREAPELIARFERAYDQHWLAVFRFAVSWTNDWTSAEDLAQEAFSRLWKDRMRIDWERDTLPWLLVVTRRLATDRFRGLSRALGGPRPRPDGIPDSDARIRWLDARRQMARLTGRERAALVLVTVIGLDTDSAARTLDTTPGAVRAAIARAREKLDQA